jgi:hypothetical protein
MAELQGPIGPARDVVVAQRQRRVIPQPSPMGWVVCPSFKSCRPEGPGESWCGGGLPDQQARNPPGIVESVPHMGFVEGDAVPFAGFGVEYPMNQNTGP